MSEPPPATNRRLLLAYAEASRDLAAPLARALEAAGFDVRHSTAGPDEAEITAARTVIVCWTPAAVASDTVTLLAARARKAGKLSAVLLAPCAPPGNLGGRSLLADLSGWHGDASDRDFITFAQAIHARQANRFLAAPIWRSRYLSWGSAGAVALGAVAIVANLGDLGQTIDNLTNPAASQRDLNALRDDVRNAVNFLKQQSPQPLSADAEAALRDSIERLLSAQSGARRQAGDRLVAGDLPGALGALRSAADEGETLARGLSETWQDIGALLYTTDTFGALDAYQRATQLAPDNPVARSQLGNLYIRTGQLEEAKRTFDDLFHFSDGDDAVGIAYGNLGVIAMMRGDLSDARIYFESGMQFSEKAGNFLARAASLSDLGEIARLERKFAEAERLLSETLAAYRQLGDRRGEALATSRLGAVARDRRQYTQAEALFREALATATAAGDAEGKALALTGLGDVALARGQLGEARAHYEASHSAAFEFAAADIEAIALIGLGNVAERQGDTTKAINHFREAWAHYRDMGLDSRQEDMMARMDRLGATASPEGPEH